MPASKRVVTTALATAAVGFAALAPTAAAEPSPSSCHGQTVKSFVQQFGGARTASELFFGDDPQAVQQGHRLIRSLCGVV